MRRTLCFVLLCLMLTICPGCWDLRPVEDLAILLSIGVDLSPDGQSFLLTSTQPVFQEPRTVEVRNAWASAKSIAHAMRLIQAQEYSNLVVGKVLIYVIGEDVWRSMPINKVAELFYTRPDASLSGLVVCAKGKAGDLLMQRPPASGRPAVAIWRLLTAAEPQGITGKLTLLDVARAGEMQRDLLLPLLENSDQLDAFLYSGSVAFSRGRPAIELSLLETATVATLGDMAVRFAFETGDPESSGTLSYTVRRAKLNVRSKERTTGGLQIDAMTRCSVTVSSPVDLRHNTDEAIRRLEVLISRDLSGRGQRLLSKLQQSDSDPLGLADSGLFISDDKARGKREQYKSAILNFRAEAKILSFATD